LATDGCLGIIPDYEFWIVEVKISNETAKTVDQSQELDACAAYQGNPQYHFITLDQHGNPTSIK
jgi:hypothetical protein